VPVVVSGLLVWHVQPGARDSPPGGLRAGPARSVDRDPLPLPQHFQPPRYQPLPASCSTVTRAFTPVAITVAGVSWRAPVVAPAREPDGVPGVPPLTEAGKAEFAWDRAQGIRPGDRAGNVLLNAHTWPDGSALGNRLLAGLHRGGRIVVRGGQERLCYRVTSRVQVSAERGMPRYYARRGPPQLAIVVCSGQRLGPGIWTMRTVWFASPAA
jgi:hypothetical protein